MNEVRDILSRGMTVADLIAELQGYPSDALVVFGCDYGDICHTTQLLPVAEVEELDYGRDKVVTSGYSQSGIALQSGDDDDEDEQDEVEADEVPDLQVVILR